MSTREKIDSLKKLVSEEIDEESIVCEGKINLEVLRNDWKSNREDFTKDDVVTLKEIGVILDALSGFIEEQEKFEYISSIEEIDEVVRRLYYILKKIDKLKVSARVNKEIRELGQKRSTLPSRAFSQKEAETKRAVAKLNANAPVCKKCGSKMILREGNNYFWGCVTFPQCWGKKWLTKKELSVLPN